jgi:hypothetical protein
MKLDAQIDSAAAQPAARLLNARLIGGVPGLFSEGYEAPAAPKPKAARPHQLVLARLALGRLTQRVAGSLKEALLSFGPTQPFEVEAARHRMDRLGTPSFLD